MIEFSQFFLGCILHLTLVVADRRLSAIRLRYGYGAVDFVRVLSRRMNAQMNLNFTGNLEIK